MQCLRCDSVDPRWDRFVQQSPDGTFFHLLGWRDLIARIFGYQPFYLYAEEYGEIAGVLPLFLVKSLLFGRSLVTIPLGVYGGIISHSEAAHALLSRSAEDLAGRLGVRYLEIRGNPYRNGKEALSLAAPEGRLVRKDLYVTFLRDIHSDPESNLACIPRKQRRMIRQAQKFGLRSIMDDDRLGDFYNVYAQSVRNLGTPVYGFSYFRELKRTFGEQCRLLLVEHRQQPVAGVVTFLYKDQILPYYGGSLPTFRHLAPNDFMYWELMSFGAARGCRVFDFGRSKKDTGSFNFKRHWGFEPTPLPYFYFRVNGAAIPDTSSLNPKLQWAVKLWRRLPLRLTKTLGPLVVRHLP
jgi:FemAB-related protein (PEP-CTERM system-associated)